MTEEMRWLEYGQRTRHGRRGVLRGSGGDCAARLFDWATLGGARSLGIRAGAIAPGCFADFFVVDKSGLSLLGSTAETLLASIVFGAGRACVTRVCVGGHWRHWP
jgi:formimidoylglutamate deiminase